MIRKFLLSAFLAAFAATLTFAQDVPQFEVATIKEAAPITDGRVAFRMGGDPGHIDYRGLPLRMILARAFEVKDYQIIGPDWLDSERFDIMAKVPDGVDRAKTPRMLQALLAERFKMKFHRDQKETNVYALVVGKNGIKVKEVPETTEGVGRMQMSSIGHLETKAPFSQLVDLLSRFADRPIIDMTEAKGTYDIKLDFQPDMANLMKMPGGGPVMMRSGDGGPGGGPGGDRGGPATDPDGKPSLFTAVQEQLGLRLDPRKAPVPTIVIDSMDKKPSEN